MFLVGIDISKYKHDCCILDSDGAVIREPFSFKNDADGFVLFLDTLNFLPDSEDIKIGFESTAHYALNLKLFLEKPTTLSWNSILYFSRSSTSLNLS